MLGETKRDRRTERREATRTEIVDAAWELCRAEGLAALSMRDIAAQVGMQAPSLYSYFASKNDIYDAMFAQGCRDFVAGQPLPGDIGDALTGLRRVMRYFVQFCTADPVRYQLLFQRTIPGFEPSPESFAISVGSFESMLAWMTEKDINVPGAIDLFTAIGTGLTDQQISNDPGGDRWTRLADEAVEMFLNHIESKKAKGKRKR